MTAIIIGTEAADTAILGFTSILRQPLASAGADRALVAILAGKPALTATEIALI